jgi:hypothetical protein
MEDFTGRNLFKGAVKLQRPHHGAWNRTRVITTGDFFDRFVPSAQVDGYSSHYWINACLDHVCAQATQKHSACRSREHLAEKSKIQSMPFKRILSTLSR